MPLALLVAGDRRAVGDAWGFEVVGRRAANDVLAGLRLDLVERRLRDQPAALDGAESAEVATAAVAGVDALETTFARYLPQVVLAAIVPLAVLVARRVDRPRLGRADAPHAAARAGLHVARRPLHGAARAGALADARAPGDALPRRRARAAHAPRLQPGRGAGREDRGGQRSLPARDDGDAARRVPLRRRARARGDARHRTRRRDRRRSPRRRRPRLRGWADRARPRARALPAAAKPRRAVPRERGRPRRRRAPARPRRGAGRPAPAAPRRAPSPRDAPVRLEAGLVRLPGARGRRARRGRSRARARGDGRARRPERRAARARSRRSSCASPSRPAAA